MRAPDKKRFLNAVNHIESEEIAFFELEADMSIVNQLLGKEFSMGLHSFEMPIDDYVELNRQMGNDMIYFAHIWRLGRKEKKDDAGRVHYIDGMMKTPKALSDIWYPDMGMLKKRLDELFKRIEGTGFGVVCQTQSAPFVVATAIGYQDYWMNTADNAGFIHDFTKKIQDWCLQELEVFSQYPVDAIKQGSAFVTKNGPMCSPDALEEFETRYLREQAKRIKEKGFPLFLHIDGNVVRMIPDLIEMGVDILNPLEPCDGTQDIYHIKRLYGDKLTLCGNIDIDSVLLNGTAEEIVRDVEEHIRKLAVGGGYIAASSHDIHQLIPLNNFCAMRDAVHNYRLKREKHG